MLRLALRNVLAHRRRSLATALATAIAICIAISARGLMNSAQAILQERIALGQTGMVTVHRRGYAANVDKSPLELAMPQSVLAEIEGVPGVVAASARIFFYTQVDSVYSLALGVDPAAELKACPRRDVEWGTLHPPLLSPELSKRVSHKATLLASDRDGVLNAIEVQAQVAENHPQFAPDKELLYVTLAQAQELLRMPQEVTEVAVQGADLEAPEALRDAVQRALGDGYEVQTWKQAAQFAVDMTTAQNAALDVVLLFFFVVLIIGVANAMLMNVLERTREIGTMLALGVRRQRVLRLLVSEAALLGGIGGVVGAVLGALSVLVMHTLGVEIKAPGGLRPDVLHPFVSFGFVALTVLAAAVSSAVAAIWPGVRAGRLSPIDALGDR